MLKILIEYECLCISSKIVKDRSEKLFNLYYLYSKIIFGKLLLFDVIVNVGFVFFIGVF